MGLAVLAACGGGEGSDVVVTPPPDGLSYATPVSAEAGVAIPALVPAISGSVTAYSVTPALPAGVVLHPTTGVISGSPTTVSEQAVYIITATNAGGSTSFGLSLKVGPSPNVPGGTANDIEPPTGVALTSPVAGMSVGGVISVTATATDNVGVAQVRFFAGNSIIGTTASAPFTVEWNTAGLSGAVQLTVEATDRAGNSATSTPVAVSVGTAVTLATLQAAVFGAYCTGCHNGTGPNLPNSMNLTSVASTASALIDVTSLQSPPLKRVSPGDPDNSYLIQKLEGTAPFGVRMPFGGPYLDQATINQVRAWIGAGAPL